jgi:hypothetical protein
LDVERVQEARLVRNDVWSAKNGQIKVLDVKNSLVKIAKRVTSIGASIVEAVDHARHKAVESLAIGGPVICAKPVVGAAAALIQASIIGSVQPEVQWLNF